MFNFRCGSGINLTFSVSISFSQDYKDIDISWQQRHFQMTPLFAATLASQPGETQMEQSVGATSDVGVRATQQNLAFTPTQGTCVSV